MYQYRMIVTSRQVILLVYTHDGRSEAALFDLDYTVKEIRACIRIAAENLGDELDKQEEDQIASHLLDALDMVQSRQEAQ